MILPITLTCTKKESDMEELMIFLMMVVPMAIIAIVMR